MIVGALAAGALAATQDTASQIIKDAYGALKNAIGKKAKGTDVAIEDLERKPGSESRIGRVKEDLQDAGVGNDTELMTLAKTLADALNKAGQGNSITQSMTNSNINTGGGTFVSGNVNTGGGDFVGRDKIRHAGQQLQHCAGT